MTSYQYEIPRASSLFGGNKVVAAVLDNWRISGISTFGTGGRGRVGVTLQSRRGVSRRRVPCEAAKTAATSTSSAIRSSPAATGISIAGSIRRRTRRDRPGRHRQ